MADRRAGDVELLRVVAAAHAIIRSPPRAVVQAAEDLEWVQITSAGVKPYLYPELVNSEVVMTNTQTLSSAPIADHGFGMLLGLTRNLVHRTLVCIPGKCAGRGAANGASDRGSARLRVPRDVSAKLRCPVLAILNCPLFEGACGIQYERVPGQAHRLQAAGGRRYGDHEAATGDPGTRCASAASLKATTAERKVGVTLPSAPAMFPQTCSGRAGRSDRTGRDGPEAARRTGHFSFAPTSRRPGLRIHNRRC